MTTKGIPPDIEMVIGREHQIDRVTELCKEQNEVDPKEIIKMLKEND